jgi:hypothetical protein
MKWLPLILVMAAAAGWGWHQRQEQARLQFQINRLRPQAEEAAALALAQQAEASNATNNVEPDAAELERLRAEHRELLRLRGEMSALRARGALSRENLEEKIREGRAETESAQRETELVLARQQAARVSKERMSTLSSYVSWATLGARLSGGTIPRSWEEVQQSIDRPFLPTAKQTPERLERMRQHLRDWFTNTARNETHSLAAFEFISAGGSVDWETPEAGRGVLFLREREPRPQPNGGWARAYGFLNGEVRQAISDSPDFTAWESQFRAAARSE